VATGRLFLWSAAHGAWVSCPPDEITWLDRRRLSDDKDVTLHRAPRCAGLRYVHRRWELFSRDTTYRVYLAPDGPDAGRTPPGAEAVRRAACHVLPVAPARYEALPVTLAEGSWLVSVGAWVLRLRLEAASLADADPPAPDLGQQVTTRAATIVRRGGGAGGPGEEAVARVRGYFERNATARLTMAYYYQEFILGRAAPQTVPMTDVVIALDLSGEGAVSDYKKLLQGFIWSERGHARDLADFLLANGLLTPADLDEARQVAADNERRGVCEIARQRLQYRPKGKRAAEGPAGLPGPPPIICGNFGRYLPKLSKLSNSPLRTPPRNACHSSGVKRRIAPCASRLLRTPISPWGRLATSTQLPLEKLSELFTQTGPESGFSGRSPRIGLPTLLPH
jgi:hypothetical protein